MSHPLDAAALARRSLVTVTDTATPQISDAATLDDLAVRADRATLLQSLARGFAHELRNPLQTLGLVPQLHLTDADTVTAERLGQAIRESVERLTHTVSRFSQVYAPADHEPGPLLVPDLLATVLELQRFQRGLSHVEVHLRVTHGLPPIEGAEADFQHALLNLITNAKEALAGRSGGEIFVTATSGAGMVELAVEDNGPGLPRGLEERAFEMFVTSKDRSEGLGLGLPVARRLAGSHGGTLRYDPPAAGGARFVLRLKAWGRRPSEGR